MWSRKTSSAPARCASAAARRKGRGVRADLDAVPRVRARAVAGAGAVGVTNAADAVAQRWQAPRRQQRAPQREAGLQQPPPGLAIALRTRQACAAAGTVGCATVGVNESRQLYGSSQPPSTLEACSSRRPASLSPAAPGNLWTNLFFDANTSPATNGSAASGAGDLAKNTSAAAAPYGLQPLEHHQCKEGPKRASLLCAPRCNRGLCHCSAGTGPLNSKLRAPAAHPWRLLACSRSPCRLLLRGKAVTKAWTREPREALLANALPVHAVRLSLRPYHLSSCALEETPKCTS